MTGQPHPHSKTPPAPSHRVGKDGGLQLDNVTHQTGFSSPMVYRQTPTSQVSIAFHNATIEGTNQNSGRPGSRDARKRGHRRCVQTILSGVLQQALCGSQGLGGVSSHPGPLSPQHISQDSQIQDGVSGLNPQRNSARRLGLFPRPQGRIFPRSYSQSRQEMAPLHMEEPHIPVHSPPFRAQPFAVGIHEASEGPPGPLPSTENQIARLPGRLARSCTVTESLPTAHIVPSNLDNETWLRRQSREIGTQPDTRVHIPGDVLQYQSSHSRPLCYQDTDARQDARTTGLSKYDFTQSARKGFGENGVTSPIADSRKAPQEAITEDVSRHFQPDCRQLEQGAHNSAMVPVSNKAVAETALASDSCAHSPPRTCRYHLHRCFTERLGGAYGQLHSRRTVASCLCFPAHQQAGVGGGIQGPHRLASEDPQGPNLDQVGQQHGCLPHQQTGWNSGSGFVPESGRRTPVGTQLGLVHHSHAHSGECQHHGGPSQQTRQDHPDRVDSSPPGTPADLGQVGETHPGPVCHKILSAAPLLCVPSTGSASSSRGRSRHVVERPTSLRLPSLVDSAEGDREGKEGRASLHSHCTPLASKDVVPKSARPKPRTTSKAKPDKRPAPAASVRHKPRKCDNSQLACMAVMRKYLRRRGMSKKAIDLFHSQFRASTSRMYHYHWANWTRWCKDNKVQDPMRPRAADIANHLAHLAQSCGRSIASVKSRRAAIGSVLAAKGNRSIISDPLIKGVIKGIGNSQRTRRSLVPQWDLAIVLDFLKGPKYKDNKTLKHDLLTYKTAFLLTLASGRRASEVANLSGSRKDFSRAPDHSLTLSFLPEFLAKNQTPGDLSPSIVIPPLYKKCDKQRPDIALCPVRALLEYRTRSATYRSPTQRALLISINKKHSTDITRATLSRWLKNLIKEAYSQLELDGKLKQNTQVPSGKVRAHEIRAWATTLASKSTAFSEIMKAAYWRSHTVFAKHYLRDVALRSEDGTLRLPAMVAAQQRLSAST